MEDSPYKPCEARQNPSWRLPRPYDTTCSTITASYVPLEEFTMEKASQTSSTSCPYRGVTSTSRPCCRARPASRPPSQPPRPPQPHLPRVGPPHVHQPMKIRLPALSSGHQPLLGGPMRIRGWVNLCGAQHGSTPPPCA